MGLLVEDDGSGAAKGKEKFTEIFFSSSPPPSQSLTRPTRRRLAARWKLIAILVASGGSDAQG